VDEVSWNTLLQVYVNESGLAGARLVMEEMRVAGVHPSQATWSALLKACAKRSDIVGARVVMEEMRMAGMSPNGFTWNILLKSYVDGSDLAGAQAVMEEMRAAGARPNKLTWNMLLDCHAKCSGDTLSSAERVALEMENEGFHLDPYAYSALIRCCSSGKAAGHPRNPSQAKHWFALYVSSWRNRGPLHPGIAYFFRRAVGSKAATDVCKALGVDLQSLISAHRATINAHRTKTKSE
jgi:pentatricopeptide repeat protein